MTKRLMRSQTRAMLGGVCGGLAEYLEVEDNLIRLLFVMFTLFSGVGVLVYIALWLILPVAGLTSQSAHEQLSQGADDIVRRAQAIGEDVRRAAESSRRPGVLVLGVTLLLVGVAFLLQVIGIRWMQWFTLNTLWPAVPILAGLVMIWHWLAGAGGRSPDE